MQINKGLRQWMQARSNSVPPDKKLSKDAVVSLFIHSIFQFGGSMAGVFLNLYLWRLTHSLWINGIYNMISFAVSPLGFALGGWIAKKKDRLVTYRAGIALFALFYLLVVLVQDRVVDYYVLFAIFGGLSGAFYWAGYLTLQYDVSTDQNRIRYLALSMVFFTSASLVGPALAGFVISRFTGLQGYIIIFSLAFLMFVLATIGSLRIQPAPSRHRKYYLGYGPKLMRRNKSWLKALFSYLVLGLLQGIMLFLPNILLFRALPREDMVGYFGVLFSGVTISMGYFLTNYSKAERGRRYMLYAALGFISGSAMLFLGVNLFTVVAFMIFYSLFNPLQGNVLNNYYYNMIGKLPLKGQLRVESVVYRESFINIGRIISITMLLVFGGDLSAERLSVVMLAVSLMQLLNIWLVEPVSPPSAPPVPVPGSTSATTVSQTAAAQEEDR